MPRSSTHKRRHESNKDETSSTLPHKKKPRSSTTTQTKNVPVKLRSNSRISSSDTRYSKISKKPSTATVDTMRPSKSLLANGSKNPVSADTPYSISVSKSEPSTPLLVFSTNKVNTTRTKTQDSICKKSPTVALVDDPSVRETTVASSSSPPVTKASGYTSILRFFLYFGTMLLLLGGNVLLGGLLVKERMDQELTLLQEVQKLEKQQDVLLGQMQRSVAHWKDVAAQCQAQTEGLIQEVQTHGRIRSSD